MAVAKLLITSRQPFAEGQAFGDVGPYEQLNGIAYFAVDPNDAANRLITDIERAPRDASGRVPFSADVRILRPTDSQRGNRRLHDSPAHHRVRGAGARSLCVGPR